ncbi:hypothetical protein [Myxococcus sp. Y35]|uniref:hypothetical protein n=1 Tax=Pseudomyxococcus flavus TaxID=3115648 RepID=UPI003CEEA821
MMQLVEKLVQFVAVKEGEAKQSYEHFRAALGSEALPPWEALPGTAMRTWFAVTHAADQRAEIAEGMANLLRAERDDARRERASLREALVLAERELRLGAAYLRTVVRLGSLMEGDAATEAVGYAESQERCAAASRHLLFEGPGQQPAAEGTA